MLNVALLSAPPPAPENIVGGMRVGAAGPVGTIYEGFTLAWGDDFDGPLDIVGPGKPSGKYYSGRIYAIPGGPSLPNRGGPTAVGHIVDPLYTGWMDSNRGVAIGYNNVRQANSVLTLQARLATTEERAHFPNPAVNLQVMAQWHTPGAILYYPGGSGEEIIVECKMRILPKAADSPPRGTSMAFVAYSAEPVTLGGQSDEIDILEGYSDVLTYNDHPWSSGSTTGNHETEFNNADIYDGNWHTESLKASKLGGVVYLDGVSKVSHSRDLNSKNKAQFVGFQAFAIGGSQSGITFNQGDWTASGTGLTSGQRIEVDWLRVWIKTGQNFYKPQVTIPSINIDYDAAGSIPLPSQLALWGASGLTEYFQAVPLEAWEPEATLTQKYTQHPACITPDLVDRSIDIDFAPVSYAISDDFNRADSDLTDDPAWELAIGTASNLVVEGNKVSTVGNPSADTKALFTDIGSQQCYVQVGMPTLTEDGGYILFNYLDEDNHIMLRKSVNHQLFVRIGGVSTLRFNGGPTATTLFKIERVGNTIYMYRAGIFMAAYQLTPAEVLGLAGGTRCGLRNGGVSRTGYFDNFETGIASMPNGAGRIHCQLQISGEPGSAHVPARFVINRGPKIRTPDVIRGGVGRALSYDFYHECDVGNIVPKTFGISGALPAGLGFDGVSAIFGTPTTVEDTEITLTVTNAVGQSAQKTITVSIAAGVFADGFNRANENLTANANWSLQAGAASGLAIVSNAVSSVTSGAIALCPNLGSADHYVQARLNSTNGARGYIVAGWADVDNYALARRTDASTWNVYVRLGGVASTRITASAPMTAGDVLRLEMQAGVMRLKVNGTTIASYTLTGAEAAALGTRAGLRSTDATAEASYFDQFEHGIL